MQGVVYCFVCLFASVCQRRAESCWLLFPGLGRLGIRHLLNPLMLTGLAEDTLSCARAEDTLTRAFLPEAVLSEDTFPCFLFRRL